MSERWYHTVEFTGPHPDFVLDDLIEAAERLGLKFEGANSDKEEGKE